MPDILVRDFDPEKLERLKARAKQNGRSLQSEVKLLLEEAVQKESVEDILKMAAKWREQFKGRKFSQSSVEMIREDRNR